MFHLSYKVIVHEKRTLVNRPAPKRRNLRPEVKTPLRHTEAAYDGEKSAFSLPRWHE